MTVNVPVPSRKARDGMAATKPNSVDDGRFCRGHPFYGRAAVRTFQDQAEPPPMQWSRSLCMDMSGKMTLPVPSQGVF